MVRRRGLALAWGLLCLALVVGAEAVAQDGTWARTTANDTLVPDLIDKGLSRPEAEARARAIVADRQKALEVAHPGLADGKYSYDCYQDIPIGTDGKPTNCFSDAAKRPARWEPKQAELDAWLKAQGYVPAECGCECGKQKVAVYTLTLNFKVGGAEEELKIPVHIAEELENCTWKSRMGNLGVMLHHRPQQLWSTQRQADALGRSMCAEAGVEFVKAKLALQCYSKPHERKTYHGRPGGPLECQ